MSTGNKTLDELALQYHTDKSSKVHGFADFYDKHLHSIRGQKVKILEIGIGKQKAPSLHMWADYFTNGIIYGYDILSPENFEINNKRIRVHKVDQSDTGQLKEALEKHGPFDLIIDDGSHMISHQKRSLRYGIPALKDGGIFIMEDLHTSLKEHYKGKNIDELPSTLEVVNNLTCEKHIYKQKTVGDALNRTSITSVIYPHRS